MMSTLLVAGVAATIAGLGGFVLGATAGTLPKRDRGVLETPDEEPRQLTPRFGEVYNPPRRRE